MKKLGKFLLWVTGIFIAFVVGCLIIYNLTTTPQERSADSARWAKEAAQREIEKHAQTSGPTPVVNDSEDQPGSPWSNPLRAESFKDGGMLGVRFTSTSDTPIRVVSVTVNGRPNCAASIAEDLRTGDSFSITNINSPWADPYAHLHVLRSDCGDTIVKARVVTDRGWYEYRFD
jgi:hypothetical protein